MIINAGSDIDVMDVEFDMISGVTSNGKHVQMSASLPANLTELLNEVKQISTQCPNEDMGNILVTVLRKHKIWPALQVKKFFKNKNYDLEHILLVYNKLFYEK
jgi:TRAP-type mannitol/chloroaromatic compound transport system substrate-binding protein